jgi:ABC-type multidrug transport system fused ATPase/permease subunit
VLHRASLARNFDRVLVMSGGKLREQGTFSELNQQDTLTRHLLAAE